MEHHGLFSKFALIGEEMELAEDVYLESDERGRLIRIEPHNRVGDIRNTLALPAFLNAHTHVGDSFAKDLGLNLPLAELVTPPNGLKHRLLRSTPKETIQCAMIDSLRFMQAGGIQGFADFREGGAPGIALIEDVLDPTLPQGYLFARYHKDVQELQSIVSKIAGIGISSPNDYPPPILEEICSFCKRHRLLFATHASETTETRQKSLRNHGKTDVEEVLRYSIPTLLVHLTYGSLKDIGAIVNGKVPVVFCPQSNALLVGKMPPINQVVKEGGLGTDNVMVNPPNLWHELQFAIKIFKLQAPTSVIDPEFWFRVVTINAAKALKKDRESGSISIGKQAHLYLINLQSWNLTPAPAVLANVLLRGDWSDISGVYYSGKPVWRWAVSCNSTN